VRIVLAEDEEQVDKLLEVAETSATKIERSSTSTRAACASTTIRG